MAERSYSVWSGGVCVAGASVPGKDVEPVTLIHRIKPGPAPPDPIEPLERAYLAARDEADRVYLNVCCGRRERDPRMRRRKVAARLAVVEARDRFSAAVRACPYRRWRGWVIGYGGHVARASDVHWTKRKAQGEQS